MSTTDPLDLFRLDGKVVVLTGASSGLGEQFARALDSVGATLVLVARRADRLQHLAGELADATTITADISEAEAPDRIIDETLARHGRLDVLINNAGMSRTIPAIDDDIDHFRYELEVDLVAPFELARKAARNMIETDRPGSIVNIGSILGRVGGGRLKTTSYAAAKGGLHNLTRELASQWARRGIRVNTIAPGWFLSEMSNEMFETEAGLGYIAQGSPMGRPGKPGELDGALLFLASDASSYVTGHVLFVDGGWTAV